MADKKISALDPATIPLAGTEVLPIVQSGATVKVSVANLTAGRAISATELTLTTGNLIVSNGKGIDFSATPGTGTSELLNDYEEGTWTPVVGRSTGGAISGTVTANGKYIKVGSLVTLFCDLEIISVSSQGTGLSQISGIPYTAARAYAGVGVIGYNTAFTTVVVASCYVHSNGNIYFHESLNTDANSTAVWKAGNLSFTVSYYV